MLRANIKPISVNQAFILLRTGRRCRSPAYLVFARRIRMLLQAQKSTFKTFESSFDGNIHAIRGTLRIGVKNMLTKKSTISEKSGDLDNCVKCLVDNVMVGKIDDSQITEWHLYKYENNVDCFELMLEIVER